MTDDDKGRRHPHAPHEPYEWREPTRDGEPRAGDDPAGPVPAGGGPARPVGADDSGTLREPTEAQEEQPNHSHAGNGTVNHGPDDQGPDGQGPAGLDSDELALRRLLHQAVRDIEPRDGTLDHLRRAVPARKARKRQAAVGMVAAALFVCTAVPAAVQISHSSGSDANPSIAGHGSQAQGGSGDGLSTEGAQQTSGGSGEQKDHGEADGGRTEGADGESGRPVDEAEKAADAYPSATAAMTAPVCTADQLGSATATTEVPDSAGSVYGTFRITNVSEAGCTVGGAGTVSPLAQGAADPTRISVLAHTSGDAAAALPDPSTEVPQLVLQPGSSYEVRFAWVPSQTCPTDSGETDGGDTGGPSPAPSPTQNPGTTTDGSSTGGDTGVAPQLFGADGTQDGSVVVSYTAEAGSPTVSATVTNACAGTVYRTGVLAGV
ncbi:hypothetical protein [Streptomyces sp. NPDC006610]|jgi:hypothetical protein|uniref:hypothetical protein n=1 Tax=Streptomyces sp. NPDC006610 TaxID=3154584 RepID=UPI0033A24F0E